MERKLWNKQILVVQGSLLAGPELREALERHGARVASTANLLSAFDLVARRNFDGAIVDHSLHNEAFDLCTEFQALGIPYLSASTPHRLQSEAARKADADMTAARLAHRLQTAVDVDEQDYADFMPPDATMTELRAI